MFNPKTLKCPVCALPWELWPKYRQDLYTPIYHSRCSFIPPMYCSDKCHHKLKDQINFAFREKKALAEGKRTLKEIRKILRSK